MKRLFLLATAAIVALASCTKTQVVNTEAPEEIAFKTVAGAMTKADLAIDVKLGVVAYLGDTEYFENSPFEHNDGSWVGGKYWPGDGDLKFTCYAPYDVNAVTYNKTANTLTIACDNSTNATDWLYGTTQPTGNKETVSVPVALNHALAQVEFNFTGTENLVSLGTVTLNDTKATGTCVVTYGNPMSVAWSAQGGDKDLTYNTEYADLTSQPKNLAAQLVVPVETQNATLNFTYKLDGNVLTYSVPAGTLGAWVHGKKYTYNVSIGATEIVFSQPTVNDFTPNTPVTSVPL